jgi:hypothetical protein
LPMARPTLIRVSDHAAADPALHPTITLIAATVETVAALADADASLAPDAPSLAAAERFCCDFVPGDVAATCRSCRGERHRGAPADLQSKTRPRDRPRRGRLLRSSRIGRERYSEYLATIPRNDHVTAVVGEAGVRLEFGNDLVRMIPCRLVINEDGSHFVINLLPVVEDKKVSRHAEPRRSDPFTIVPFKLHGHKVRIRPILGGSGITTASGANTDWHL